MNKTDLYCIKCLNITNNSSIIKVKCVFGVIKLYCDCIDFNLKKIGYEGLSEEEK